MCVVVFVCVCLSGVCAAPSLGVLPLCLRVSSNPCACVRLCASTRVCVCVSVSALVSVRPCAFVRVCGHHLMWDCPGVGKVDEILGWGWVRLHALPPPDQLFGILARAISVMDCILDPDDIARVIHSVFWQPALQSFLKQSEVCVQRLRVVRDWQSWHNHLRLELKGGLLVDSTATHFFLFTKRSSPVLKLLSKSCVRVMCPNHRFEQSGSTSRSPWRSSMVRGAGLCGQQH